jgi:hypothetical protein
MRYDDPALAVPSDSVSMRDKRLLQSWYRETELRAQPGPSGERPVVGSSLTKEDVAAQPSLNFIDPYAFAHAEQRAVEVQAEGGTLDADRLFRNMLSSMPLCFNVFGALGRHPEFLSLFREAFNPQATSVEKVVCEWAPRPASDHLDDRTAFDAAVWFTDSDNRPCFLGIEVKYTEPFSLKEYDSPRYREVAERSRWFRADASDRLVKRSSNQLWRNMLLAASMEQHAEPTVDWAGVAVLSLEGDAGVTAAVSSVTADLIDSTRLTVVSLERLLDAAHGHPEFRGWAERFRRRYLGPIEEVVDEPPVGPAPTRRLRPAERVYSSDDAGDGVDPLSWRLTAHLLGETQGLAQVHERHTGGIYDELVLTRVVQDDERVTVALNRAGSARVCDAEGSPPPDDWWVWRGVWEELRAGCPLVNAARLLAHHAGLVLGGRWTASAFAALAVADVVDLDGVRCLQASAWQDTSLREAFAAFGESLLSLDPFEPAWWMVVRGTEAEPRAAVNLATGWAFTADGPHDLTATAGRTRLVASVAELAPS